MTIIRTTEVARLTGLSRTTIWRLERKGSFPARLRLGSHSCGWIEDDIRHWIETRPRGMALAKTPIQRAARDSSTSGTNAG